MSLVEQLQAAVIDGRLSTAEELARKGVAEGIPPVALFSDALAPAMVEVGLRMQRNEYYIPEVLVAARAMKAALAVLKPLMSERDDANARGKVVIGTVRGDLHDIGKNLVAMMLEGAGFQVVDLGSDVSAQTFVQAVREHRPRVLGMSALLTTTMLQMVGVLEGLEAAGLRAGVKVMVGGAPLSRQFAEEIGADGYGPDALSAAELAKSWAPVI